MNWFNSLTNEKQDAVRSIMIEMVNTTAQHAKRERDLSAPYGQIPVGSAFFDYTLKICMLESVIFAINRGCNPTEAMEAARVDGVACVKTHNSRRKDINWQRAEPTGNEVLYFIQRLTEAGK